MGTRAALHTSFSISVKEGKAVDERRNGRLLPLIRYLLGGVFSRSMGSAEFWD